MSTKRILLLLGVGAVILAACGGAAGEPGPAGADGSPGPAGEQGPPGSAMTVADLSCSECHNDTTVLFQAQQQWAKSMHATGTSAGYAGGRGDCTGCHSSEGFSGMIAAGQTAEEYAEAGEVPLVPSNPNCRTCHEIHTTYTGDDFALTTSDAVTLTAFEETTYDGGMGNLCVNCHQPRREIAEAVDGMIEVDSTHWGPHHGPQSAMLLGLGGAGVEGSASPHTSVTDTCVTCHVSEGNGYDHSMEPAVASCTGCHTGLEDLDYSGVMTEVDALIEELHELLEAKGLYHDGHPVVGSYAEAEAWALWNYIFIAVEDGSHGVHNSKYTIALLEASIEALK